MRSAIFTIAAAQLAPPAVVPTSLELMIGLAGIFLGLLGIIASIVVGFITLRQTSSIASRQTEQLHDLNDQKQRADRVRSFFRLNSDISQPAACIYPAQDVGKPFPSINEGDHAALHILVDLIGAQNLKLVPEISGRHKSVPRDSTVIFLCSPSANRALHSIYSPIEVGESATLKRTPADALKKQNYAADLPCWFLHDHGCPNFPPTPQSPYLKKIWIRDPDQEMSSPAEPEYRNAAIKPGSYAPEQQRLEDLAILARTREGSRRIFILSGIHQYGTVIAAKLIQLVVQGEIDDPYGVLLSDSDFVAVLCGTYDVSRLDVTNCGVKPGYLWTRQPNLQTPWIRRDD
jgi:hypothetical protein